MDNLFKNLKQFEISEENQNRIKNEIELQGQDEEAVVRGFTPLEKLILFKVQLQKILQNVFLKKKRN